MRADFESRPGLELLFPEELLLTDPDKARKMLVKYWEGKEQKMQDLLIEAEVKPEYLHVYNNDLQTYIDQHRVLDSAEARREFREGIQLSSINAMYISDINIETNNIVTAGEVFTGYSVARLHRLLLSSHLAYPSASDLADIISFTGGIPMIPAR